MSEKDVLYRILADRPIAFHPDIAKAVGNLAAGVFLSQLLYWSGKEKSGDGWIYKTQDEWFEETSLTRKPQETARNILRKLRLINEKRKGVPAKLYYQLNFAELFKLLEKYYESQDALLVQSRMPKGGNLKDRSNGANQNALVVQSRMHRRDNLSIAEITTENTTEITRSKITEIIENSIKGARPETKKDLTDYLFGKTSELKTEMGKKAFALIKNRLGNLKPLGETAG